MFFDANNSLKGTAVLDPNIISVNQIRILISEAHYHFDNFEITSTSYEPYVYCDDFSDDLYATRSKYYYNTNSERIMKVDPDGITRYITNDGKVFAEYDGDGNLKYNYIYGNGQKLARKNAAGNVEYYHNDYLGSARNMTNSSGQNIWTRDYYPFGEDMDASGVGNDYKFTGKVEARRRSRTRSVGKWYEESKFFYSWKRFYDPFTGRFISVDPKWSSYLSHTPYQYAFNNPFRFWDPTGMWTDPIKNPQYRGWYSDRWRPSQSMFGKVRGTSYHYGVDLYAKIGTPTLAVEKGIIVYTGFLTGYGNTAVIKYTDENGKIRYALYGHLKESGVKQGETVKEGQEIGKTGNTGNASIQKKRESHLYFEILKKWLTWPKGTDKEKSEAREDPAKKMDIDEARKEDQNE